MSSLQRASGTSTEPCVANLSCSAVHMFCDIQLCRAQTCEAVQGRRTGANMSWTGRTNDCERDGDVTEVDRKFGRTSSEPVHGVVSCPRCRVSFTRMALLSCFGLPGTYRPVSKRGDGTRIVRLISISVRRRDNLLYANLLLQLREHAYDACKPVW